MTSIVTTNAKEVERDINRLSKGLNRARRGEVDRAVAYVLNQMASKGKTLAVRAAAKSLSVRQKGVRPRIKVVRATAKYLTVKFWAGSAPMGALGAGAKPSADGYALGPYRWDNAFEAVGKNNKRHIFFRDPKRKERGPLRPRSRYMNRKSGYPLNRAELGEKFVFGELKKAVDHAALSVVEQDYKALLHRELSYRLDKLLK